jgi:transposase-like protein
MERRKFTREFKLEAVRLITERDVFYTQASADLGVRQSQLRGWVKKLADDPQHAFQLRELSAPLFSLRPATLRHPGRPSSSQASDRCCCLPSWRRAAEYNLQPFEDDGHFPMHHPTSDAIPRWAPIVEKFLVRYRRPSTVPCLVNLNVSPLTWDVV